MRNAVRRGRHRRRTACVGSHQSMMVVLGSAALTALCLFVLQEVGIGPSMLPGGSIVRTGQEDNTSLPDHVLATAFIGRQRHRIVEGSSPALPPSSPVASQSCDGCSGKSNARMPVPTSVVRAAHRDRWRSVHHRRKEPRQCTPETPSSTVRAGGDEPAPRTEPTGPSSRLEQPARVDVSMW